MSAAETGRIEWAHRFRQQGRACAELGSELYGRLLPLIADDLEAGGPTWEVLSPHGGLRFGQAAPLRLLGTAHRLALEGAAPKWAALLPSCGGAAPESDRELAEAWLEHVREFHDHLVDGLGHEVQTNEVGRSAALALAQALAHMPPCRIIEIGTSAGLNLRLGHYRTDLGGLVLGDPHSEVSLRPEIRSSGEVTLDPSLLVPTITELIGIDPNPLDVGSEEASLRLLGFLWPDQDDRIERTRAAIGIARRVPATVIPTDDTAEALSDLLGRPGPTIIQHSITWQYIPTSGRWQITDAIEAAGRAATTEAPIAWIRYEPDEWHRGRASLRLRRWPGGTDILVGHVDYHGRWLEPIDLSPGWAV